VASMRLSVGKAVQWDMARTPLITPTDLAARLGDPSWVIVDCRFTLTEPSAGRAAYEQGHIPGARYADLDRDLARPAAPHEGRHPLPDPEAFAATLGAWGIDNDSTVVAYDDASGAIAARLWWLMGWLGHTSCLVLDGGFAAWTGADLPVETETPSWQSRRFVARGVQDDAVVTTDELPRLQGSGALLLDARAAPRYRGEQEPIDPKAGHVPGAVNWPFSNNVDERGAFKRPEELRRGFEELLGGRAPHEVIAMCGSGVTACHLLLAMAVAGLPGGRLYVGSWSEWIRDPARPIRTGAAP
jgi:thiosulfate/3-mercaptopyruvate sulfurtransferase